MDKMITIKKNLTLSIIAVFFLLIACNLKDKKINIKVEYASYLGGNNLEDGCSIDLDNHGNLCITGNTQSRDFPITNAVYDETYNGGDNEWWGGDVFVAKFNNDSTSLLFGTFVGGSEIEGHTYFIDTDNNGYIYVTGLTYSSDFPVTKNAFDTSFNGESDIFIFKIDPNGKELIYSTFIGGKNNETPNDIAVDKKGNVYVLGRTDSKNFPVTSGSFDPEHNGGCDAFILKLNPRGDQLVYSSFLGGSDDGDNYGIGNIAIDNYENVYVATSVGSKDYPTTENSLNTKFNGGETDIYLAKLIKDGSKLEYASFLGGTKTERVSAMILDNSGNMILFGNTQSNDFPITPSAYDTTYNGGSEQPWGGDLFIAKFNFSTNQLDFCTFLGGSKDENATCIDIDESGNIYVGGSTKSSDFPITINAIQNNLNGNSDIFFAVMNPNGNDLQYSSFYGGSGSDFATSLTFHNDAVFIGGGTDSKDFPLSENAMQKIYGGGSNDNFLLKISM